MAAAFLSFAGCSKPADIVVDQPPFINLRCEYKSFDEIFNMVDAIARSNGLSIRTDVTNKELGVFSFLFWKKDFNIVIAGIPRAKSLYFSALKRGPENSQDIGLASSIKQSLSLTCLTADSNSAKK